MYNTLSNMKKQYIITAPCLLFDVAVIINNILLFIIMAQFTYNIELYVALKDHAYTNEIELHRDNHTGT